MAETNLAQVVSFTRGSDGHVIPGLPAPLSCPFCGEDGPEISQEHMEEGDAFTVGCSECNCEAGPVDTAHGAALLWNTRGAGAYRQLHADVVLPPQAPPFKGALTVPDLAEYLVDMLGCSAYQAESVGWGIVCGLTWYRGIRPNLLLSALSEHVPSRPTAERAA